MLMVLWPRHSGSAQLVSLPKLGNAAAVTWGSAGPGQAGSLCTCLVIGAVAHLGLSSPIKELGLSVANRISRMSWDLGSEV